MEYVNDHASFNSKTKQNLDCKHASFQTTAEFPLNPVCEHDMPVTNGFSQKD